MVALALAASICLVDEDRWTEFALTDPSYTFLCEYQGRRCRVSIQLQRPIGLIRDTIAKAEGDEDGILEYKLDLFNGDTLSGLAERASLKSDGADIILGRDAFVGKKLKWDITGFAFAFSSQSPLLKAGSVFSLEEGLFKNNGEVFRLPMFGIRSYVYSLSAKPGRKNWKTWLIYDPEESHHTVYDDDGTRTELLGEWQNSLDLKVVGGSFFGNQVVEIDFRTRRLKFEDRQAHRSLTVLNSLSDDRFVVKGEEAVLVGHDNQTVAHKYLKAGLIGRPLRIIGDMPIKLADLDTTSGLTQAVGSYNGHNQVGVEKEGKIIMLNEVAQQKSKV
jgi:hypothetical protein